MPKLSDAELYELGVRAHAIASHTRARITAYGVGYEDGTVHDPEYYACHGWFYDSNRGASPSDPVVIASVVQNERDIASKEIRDCYYQYLLNESPFAPVFLSKDVDKLEDEGIISRLDVQHAYAIAASIATRHAWEYKNVVTAFYNLVQAGLQKDRAFLSAFCLLWPDVNQPPKCKYTEGHTSVYVRSMNKSGVVNFLNHNMPRKGQTYSKYKKYTGIELLWNQDNRFESAPLTKFSEVFPSAYDDVEVRVKDPFGVLTVAKAVHQQEQTVVEKVNEIFDEIVA